MLTNVATPCCAVADIPRSCCGSPACSAISTPSWPRIANRAAPPRASPSAASRTSRGTRRATSAQRRALGVLLVRLAVVVLERLDAADHAEPAPEDLVRARVPRHVVRAPRAVDEHGDAVGPGEERVRDPGSRGAGDDVSGPERHLLAPRAARRGHRRRPQLERALALDDHEHLFLLGMAVRRRA